VVGDHFEDQAIPVCMNFVYLWGVLFALDWSTIQSLLQGQTLQFLLFATTLITTYTLDHCTDQKPRAVFLLFGQDSTRIWVLHFCLGKNMV
jgi:hypothetical protein